MSEQEKAKKDIWYITFWEWTKDHTGFLFCLGLCICGGWASLHAFRQFQDWSFSYPANHEQWGLYGDFVGGVIGTVVAVFSVYFLIETLRSQQQANTKEQENFNKTAIVYKVQQFDNNYNQLVKLYQESIEGYKYAGLEGRDALRKLVEQLYVEEYNAKVEYSERVAAATELFDRKFYIENRKNAAVHFRVLYRKFDLIEKSGLKEHEYKVKYAKLQRCQLDENELVLLRYNCGCKYGEQMRQHINHYNLLKHLPPLSLLEFSFWRNNVIKDSYCRNAIDTELIAQRKWIREKFGDANPMVDSRYTIPVTQRYKWSIGISMGKKQFAYALIQDSEKPSSQAIDRAFDTLVQTYDYAYDFIVDFLHEVLEYSNFGIYNGFARITYERGSGAGLELNNNCSAIEVIVKAKEVIALRYIDYMKPAEEDSPKKVQGRFSLFIDRVFKRKEKKVAQSEQQSIHI